MLSGCGTKEEQTISYLNDSQQENENSVNKQRNEELDKKQKDDIVFMQVDGAVKHPGVYELHGDDRIKSLIEAAGGFLKEASRRSVNQAAKVVDGQQIYVPTLAEEEQGIGEDRKDEIVSKVNINTADQEMLMTLPGVGSSKALSIISYREEHGGFSKIEELMNITGIKQGVYNKLKDQITV